MTKLTTEQKEKYDSLFLEKQPAWTGTITELVNFCEKQIKKDYPKPKKVKNAEI